MQKLYANCTGQAKTQWLNCDSGYLHFNIEEKWKVQLSQIFCIVFNCITAVINSIKLTKLQMDMYLSNILYQTKRCDFLKWGYLFSDFSVQDLPVVLKWDSLQTLAKALDSFIELQICKSDFIFWTVTKMWGGHLYHRFRVLKGIFHTFYQLLLL